MKSLYAALIILFLWLAIVLASVFNWKHEIINFDNLPSPIEQENRLGDMY